MVEIDVSVSLIGSVVIFFWPNHVGERKKDHVQRVTVVEGRAGCHSPIRR